MWISKIVCQAQASLSVCNILSPSMEEIFQLCHNNYSGLLPTMEEFSTLPWQHTGGWLSTMKEISNFDMVIILAYYIPWRNHQLCYDNILTNHLPSRISLFYHDNILVAGHLTWREFSISTMTTNWWPVSFHGGNLPTLPWKHTVGLIIYYKGTFHTLPWQHMRGLPSTMEGLSQLCHDNIWVACLLLRRYFTISPPWHIPLACNLT